MSFKSVLLVEDSEQFGKQIKRTIEVTLQAQVFWCKNDAELETALFDPSISFNLAICDYHLPDAPEGEAIIRLRQAGLLTLVVTGKDDEQTRQDIWKLGVSDYFHKGETTIFQDVASACRRLSQNRKSKVLIVDDSKVACQVFSTLLKLQNYQVDVVHSGEEALTKLTGSTDYDLLLTDYNMQGMTGAELCKELRRQPRFSDLAIIGISSADTPLMAARFLKSGANDFIVKQSYILEEFFVRVQRNIEMTKLIRSVRAAATTDYLTNLKNRRALFSDTKPWFRTQTLAVAVIDIDHFKLINDEYGHQAGDWVLQHLAEVLEEHSPDGAMVARLGGEEFCIVFGDEHDPDETLENLRVEIAQPLMPPSDAFPEKITASIGYVFGKLNSLDDAIRDADRLLYQAKNEGRNCIRGEYSHPQADPV
ncbi:diguanylate cyclase domain-containing protein [Salinibius halmophilus]|uniref:diguanylate cyclase domain-containing protein n=1 Tax=Salinibius halmophilus TaxID=1853216 RepID=UPI000E66EBB8|nr:diguanylate cyclase [Salinibius halmophilus]